MAWHGSVSPRGTGIDHKRPHESVDYISHNVSSKRRDDSSGLGGAGGAGGAAGAAGEAGAAGAAGLWAGNRGLGAGLVTGPDWTAVPPVASESVHNNSLAESTSSGVSSPRSGGAKSESSVGQTAARHLKCLA